MFKEKCLTISFSLPLVFLRWITETIINSECALFAALCTFDILVTNLLDLSALWLRVDRKS